MASGLFAGTLGDGTQVLLVLQSNQYFLEAGNFVSKGSYSIASIALTGTGVGYDLTATNENLGSVTMRGTYKTDRHIQLSWQEPNTGSERSLIVEGSSLYFNNSPISKVLGSWVNQDQKNLTFFTVSQNHNPVATDDFFAVQPGVESELPVLNNDRDVDGDAIHVSHVDANSTAGGTVVLDDGGTPDDYSDDRVLYTPPAGVSAGSDTFSYDLTDAQKGTDKANVTLTLPVRDGDVGIAMTASDEAPLAGDSVTVTATVTNNSDVDAQVQSYIDVPDGLLLRNDDGGTTFDQKTGTWIVNLPASQSKALTLTFVVANYGNFDLKASIQTLDIADTDSSNDDAEVTFVPGDLASSAPAKAQTAQIQGVILSSLTQITGSISEASNGWNAYPITLSVGAGLGGGTTTSSPDPYTGFVVISSELVTPNSSSTGSGTDTGTTTPAVPEQRATMLILTASPSGVYLNKLYYVKQSELSGQPTSVTLG
ncbi:MAG TPA: cadherin-like domain-containing protein, partial [Pseudomonadales bacterium]|nr:cadherin-like domain-containing protein [Pseudomonadales bacterium]